MVFELRRLMSFSLIRQLKSEVKLDSIKRCYARGSRLFPPSVESDSNQQNSSKNNGTSESSARPHQVTKESPKQLLENSFSFGKDGISKSDKPYPKNSNWDQSQAKHSFRPACNPKDTSIILFPGQGTQFVGMGRDLLQYPQVKDMYKLASSILGYNLLSLCLDGPKETLDQTLFCQPAVLVTSLACLEKLKATNPHALSSCIATAGFSVGEIAALVFAGSLTFENAVQLVKIRAEAMQLASEMVPSGMMTVFYGPDSELNSCLAAARKHCQLLGLENIECKVANYLYPDCKVIAGNNEALAFISKHAADYKLRRLKRLPVSGAFHTKLMEPGVEIIQKFLKKTPIHDPSIPVHSNIDGKRYRDSKHIIKCLPQLLIKPVVWEQTMHILYERNQDQQFPKTYEMGPGSSLKAILKMVNARAANSCTSISVK